VRNWTIAWRADESCLTRPHMFLRPQLPGEHQKIWTHSWHTSVIIRVTAKRSGSDDYTARFP
jgi:hypothetical protein